MTDNETLYLCWASLPNYHYYVNFCPLEVALKASVYLVDKNLAYLHFSYSACQLFHGFHAEGSFTKSVSQTVLLCLKKGTVFSPDSALSQQHPLPFLPPPQPTPAFIYP